MERDAPQIHDEREGEKPIVVMVPVTSIWNWLKDKVK
jgi:hypothetical protein